MEDPILVCPVCCNEKFTSKQSLVDHLSDIQCNINCPVCSIKCLSLENLINHLRDDNCVAFNIDETIISQRNLSSPVNSKHTVLNHNFESIKTDENRTQNGIFDSELPNHTDKSFVEPETYYVDLLSKQSKKSYLEDQHLKFPKMDGEGQYLIMTGNRVLLTSASAVVTKQNIDGTISLNTIKDMNLEPETDMTAVDNEMIENKEEIYSCNTCGVSFSSVTEHIQNYHNDQVVVVEGTDENTATTTSVELVNEEPTDRQPSRRMITDTGDIIETPVLDDEKIDVNNTKNIVVQITENISGKDVTHCVLFDEYNDQAITDTSKSEDYDTFHKNVVLKEMETETGNKIKVYYCETCHLYVTSLSQFKLQPCKKTKYVCPHCPMSYDKAKSLCAHMKVHKNQIGEKVSKPATFECEICSTVFPTSKSFKLHRRMHDPIKSRPIEVPVEMLGGVERTDDRFLCLVCDKLIPVYYRTIHQNSHKASGKMICDICNKKFESKDYLEMHMTVHNMDKAPVGKQDQSLPYDCLYCARKFARPHEKVKHERIHTGEKPHSCEICGKAFRVSYCLTLHMRTHTGARPYACPHCNKRFKAHSVFNHHLLTHSEVRAYKCPFCPKAFKTSVQLAGHKNSHTKPFACQQCNRPFASLYAVRVHMETHARTNSLKYACVQCGASYARAFALNDHMRQAHSEDTSLTNANDALTRLKEDKWITEEIVDADDLPALNKDLANDINELALNANELIVP